MERIALGVEYDGAYFKGWQRQKDVMTVQEVVEDAVSNILQSRVNVICAGRTDTGVHGLGQVVHLETDIKRPQEAWIKGVNSHLPKSVRIKWFKTMPKDFHARFSAHFRRYLYFIYANPISPGILNHGVTWVHYPLDVQAMKQAVEFWLGEHDFSAFRTAACQAKTPVRHMYHFEVKRVGQLICLDIKANAFLHNMIRNMVGVLLKIGRGHEPISFAKRILEGRDRTLAPGTASPKGLYLYEVGYPEMYQIPKPEALPWFLQTEPTERS